MPPFQGHSILFLTPPRHVSVQINRAPQSPATEEFYRRREKGFPSLPNERPSEGDRKCYCTLMTPQRSANYGEREEEEKCNLYEMQFMIMQQQRQEQQHTSEKGLTMTIVQVKRI